MSAAELAILITLKDQASKGLAGIGDALGSGIGKAAKIGAAAMVGIGVAAGAASVVSLKSFASFQQGMNEVFTLIPGAGKEAFDDLTKQTKSFAKDFGVLPDKVVPALYQALSAGVPRENVFTFLEVAQKAAVGGVTELETAVDGISSVVNAYGSDVLDATQASDLMFTAVRLGKTNFDELSRSLFQVTPTAAALGVEFGDVTAALAALTAQGVPTSVATTQLRQLFVELSKEGTATSKVFTDMAGKSFKEFIAAGGNTQDALQLLEQYAADAGVSISDLFGSVEAGAAALALTGQGTDAFATALAEMRTSAGATDEAYAQMQKGLNQSIARIRAAFEVLKIEVGSRLAPVFAAFLAFVIAKGIPFLTRLAKLIEGPLARGFGIARDAIKTFIAALSGDWTDDRRIMGLHRAFGLVGEAIRNLVLAFQQGGIIGLFRELASIALSAFTSIDWAGIGQTILNGITGALSTLGSLAWDAGVWFMGLLSGVDWSAVGQAILNGVTGALSTITGLVFDAGAWLLGMMTGVDWNSTARTIGQSVLDGLATAGGWLFDAGVWILDRFKDVAWVDTGTAIGQAILDAIVAGAGYVWDAVTWFAGLLAEVAWVDTGTAIGQAILDAIVAGAGYVWDAVTWFAALVSAVEWDSVGSAIGQAILDAITDAKTLVWDAAQWLVGIVSEVDWTPIAEAIKQGIADAFGKVDFSALTTAINEQLRIEPDEETTSKWDEWLKTLQPLIEPIATALDNFGGAADRLWGSLGNLISSGKGLVEAFAPWRELISPIRGILDEIAGAGLWVVIQIILTPLRWLTGELEKMAFVLDAVSLVARLASPIIEAVGNAFLWLRDNIPGALSAVQEFASKTITAIGEMPGKVLGFFVSLYTSAMEWFRATKDDTVRLVGELTDGVIEWLRGLPGRAVEALGDLYSLALEIGKDFLRGIRDGLQDIPILGEIVTAIGWIGEQFNKIDVPGRSPVDEAGREIGGEFVENIAIGIESSASSLLGAVALLGTTIADAANRYITAIMEDGDYLNDWLTHLPESWRASLSAAGEMIAGESATVQEAFRKYIEFVIAEGDVLNDWLTHLPENARESVQTLGAEIAAGMESVAAEISGAWLDMIGELDDIISGEAATRLGQSLRDLQQQMTFALAAGAPQAVIESLQATIAETEAQLFQVGQAYGIALTAGLVDPIANLNLDSIAERVTGIIDGTLLPTLQADFERINAVIAFGAAEGWSAELLAAYQIQANELGAELAGVNERMMIASAAGLLSPSVTTAWISGVRDLSDNAIMALEEQFEGVAAIVNQVLTEVGEGLSDSDILNLWRDAAEQIGRTLIHAIPVDDLLALIPQMEDGGAQLIAGLAEGMASGAASLDDVLAILRQMHAFTIDELVGTTGVGMAAIIAELETLEAALIGDLAQAFLIGTDPDGINANIEAIRALLAALQVDIVKTSDDLLYMGTLSGSGPGTAMREGAPMGGGSTPRGGAGSVSAPIHQTINFNVDGRTLANITTNELVSSQDLNVGLVS